MGFFSIFKRHPPKVEEAYYAQLSESAIDIDDEMIEDAINQTEHLAETWPYASLSDLEIFLSYIKQNYVVSTGEILRLGEIEYMMNNGKTNQPEETGLTWSPVEIRPDSDHFTVETVRSTLNDAETRLNDDISYTDIAESLQQLLDAAVDYAETPLEELPSLPTEDEYVEAVRKNLPLEIEANKYVSPGPEAENVDAYYPPTSEDTAAVTEAEQNGVEPMPNTMPTGDDESAADFTGAKQALENLADMLGADSPAQTTMEVSEPITEDVFASQRVAQGPTTSTASSHFQAVDQFHIEMPLFEIDENLVNQTLTPDDDNYVMSELEKAKKEANQYLCLSAEKFEATIREKLVKVVDTSDYDAEKQQLLSSNWQDDLKAKISADVSERFVGQKEQANSQIERQFENDSLAEKERHERTMTTLQQQKEADIARSNELLSEQERQTILTEQTQKLAEQELYIKQLIAELDNKFNHELTAKLTEAINHYRPVATASLDAGYKQIKAQLAEDEQLLTEKHEQAVAKKLEISKQMVAEHDVDSMQARLSTLANSEINMTKENKDLINQLHDVKNSRAQLLEEVNQLHQRLAVADSANATANQAKHSELIENLVAASLTNNLSQTQTPKPEVKRSRGGRILVTLLSMIALGGAGFGIYSYQTVETLKHEQASALEAAKAEAKVKEEKPVTEPKQEKQDDFNLLDDSLKQGSLGVYNAKYVGKDLKTENRTYKVGQLLLAQGLVDDAWSVASDNAGHNERLITTLKNQQGGANGLS